MGTLSSRRHTFKNFKFWAHIVKRLARERLGTRWAKYPLNRCRMKRERNGTERNGTERNETNDARERASEWMVGARSVMSHICIYIYIYMYMYVCISMYIYIYIYIYIGRVLPLDPERLRRPHCDVAEDPLLGIGWAVERLAEYCRWDCIVWTLEFDEIVPLRFSHMYQ